ncbi:XK-related protein 8 isoform X2 [Moschus berezovskii]|uniref:XK-related protein 8 isoform X2 n=1 Tax=Moschus berezovskii TaxID=68408 RepID=UPI002444609A|nr:XK-related protein 8 isoform X2 [Moschus berezovskii]
MPWSPRAVLLRDLVLGILGTLAFLIDLGADLWAASQYVLSGRYLWAALVLALLGLASVALQLFSWIWLRSDVSSPLAPKPPGRYLALLHLLQLGYLYRCVQGLQQGLLVWRQEVPSEFDLAYADFLSLDISMLRLFETFLETTPQLTLVLAIILQSGSAEYYQYHCMAGKLHEPMVLTPHYRKHDKASSCSDTSPQRNSALKGGSKITVEGDCSHEIKRRLLLGREVMTNLDSILKSRDITLSTKVRLVKAMVFPVVMYGCESWTIKKADRRRIDAFELWCRKRLASPLDCKEIQPVNPKGDQSWVFTGRTDVEAETPILWPPDAES